MVGAGEWLGAYISLTFLDLHFSGAYISPALDFSGDYISPAPRFLWRLHWAYYRWWECTYIVDFASVVGICRCTRNTFEAGEEPFRKRVE